MSSFNKSKTIMVTLLTCATFGAHAAWWDAWKTAGDDGNATTKGNAAAATAKSQSAIISVAIVNNTNTVLGSAVLKDKAGKVLYTSTKGKTCAIGDVCRLRVNRSALNKNTTFFFYDTKNNLTSAYMVKDTPAPTAIGYDIGVSMNSLGMYVLNRIQTINPKISYNRIDQDIVTTTLQATPYEELADYYLDLLGSSRDDSKIIAGLAAQFANNKAIPANPDSVRLAKLKAQKVAVQNSGTPVKSTPVKSGKLSLQSSSAQETLCSTEVQTALGLISKTPIPFASTTADIASYISGKACTSNDPMADKFSEISSQITTLQGTLDDTYNLVASSTQKLAELSAIKAQTDTQIVGSPLSVWINNYATTLAKLKAADGKPRNSIAEIVASYGGVENAIAKNPNMYLALNTVYANSHEAHIALVNLGDTLLFNNLTANLNALCKNGNNIVDGVFHLRSYCDVVIASVYTKNVMVAEKFRYAYRDVNQVYEMDSRTTYKGTMHWENIPNSDFDKYENKIKVISPQNIFFNMIEPTDSIAATADNLKNAGFAINEWYPDKNKRYIEVQTYVAGTTIKSKYAYQEPTRSSTGLTYDDGAKIDSKVFYVMGVPVPARYFTDYGSNSAFPMPLKSSLADIGTAPGTDFPNARVIADFKFPASGNAAVYADGFHPENTFNSKPYIGSGNNGSITQQTYDGKTFSREMFSAQNGMFRVATTAFRDFKLVGGGEYFTYIRYTSADGYSQIWAMRTWYEGYAAINPNGTPGYRLYGAPQCMTNDCVAVDTGAKLDKLYFWKGYNIEWAYENLSDDHSVFTLK